MTAKASTCSGCACALDDANLWFTDWGLCFACYTRWSPTTDTRHYHLTRVSTSVDSAHSGRITLMPLHLRGEWLSAVPDWPQAKALYIEVLGVPVCISLEEENFVEDEDNWRVQVALLKSRVPLGAYVSHINLSTYPKGVMERFAVRATGQPWAVITSQNQGRGEIVQVACDWPLHTDFLINLARRGLLVEPLSLGPTILLGTNKAALHADGLYRTVQRLPLSERPYHTWTALVVYAFQPGRAGYLLGYADPVTGAPMWRVERRHINPDLCQVYSNLNLDAHGTELLAQDDYAFWERRKPGRGKAGRPEGRTSYSKDAFLEAYISACRALPDATDEQRVAEVGRILGGYLSVDTQSRYLKRWGHELPLDLRL